MGYVEVIDKAFVGVKPMQSSPSGDSFHQCIVIAVDLEGHWISGAVAAGASAMVYILLMIWLAAVMKARTPKVSALNECIWLSAPGHFPLL